MEDYRDVDQRLLSELGRNPTLEEIAESMHTTVQEAAVYADMVSAARMRKKIEAIPYLSVREQSGADIIKALTGREAQVLQDPTLWTGADEWRAVSAAPANMPQKPYLLCYFLRRAYHGNCLFLRYTFIHSVIDHFAVEIQAFLNVAFRHA